MNLRKRLSGNSRAVPCGELHSDDGLDPQAFFRRDHWRKSDRRKGLQLCHQVLETLSLGLAEDGADDLLAELMVVAVNPAPDTTQLLVVVAPLSRDVVLDPREVVDCLHRNASRLRSIVAAAITRRRAPRLTFQYLSHGTQQEHDL